MIIIFNYVGNEQGATVDTLTAQPVTRHDVSLVYITAVLLLGAVVAVASSVGVTAVLTGTALFAGCGVGYALFYRPPGGWQ